MIEPVFELAAFRFLRPWWLLALLLLPVLAWRWRAWQRRRNAWRDLVDAHLLPHLLTTSDRRRRWPWIWLLAIAVGVLALAGPSWRAGSLPLWQTHSPLVIAVDLSEPALATDLPPSRLLQARTRIATLLAKRHAGQVGLVAYSGDAYTVAPLTDDVANIALFLDALAPDVMPDFGADLPHGDAGRAIVHARRLLQRAGFSEGTILLLAAGAPADARREAAAAATLGFRTSVLALGRAEGGDYPRMLGGPGHSRLDADALQALATAGGGRYAQAAPAGADLRELSVLNPAGTATAAAGGEQRQIALDQGFWLLPLLLVLVLWLFRRGGVLAVLAIALILPTLPMPASAQTSADVDSARADADVAGGWWRRADQQAHALQRLGEAAYRRGDYDEAAQAFAADGSARGQYNLGNALAKQGRYEEAIAAYDRALRQSPDMADAVENRRIVAAAQRQQPPGGGRQPQSSQPQDGRSNAGSAGDQGGQDRGSADPPQGSAPPQPASAARGQGREQGGGTPAEPSSTGDPEQQAQADAAQRERMQRALEQAQGQQQHEDPATAPDAETAAERERRIVNEAQLQRVEDDPGGLLRAKFRLERQRRLDGGRP
ncbi:MAG: tetratricopeptide repeat protein [Pseudoxanthomonas suwonensis]|nr:tetratricopeptide repeat protein [Pseudoxanthomonas suwonensis]